MSKPSPSVMIDRSMVGATKNVMFGATKNVVGVVAKHKYAQSVGSFLVANGPRPQSGTPSPGYSNTCSTGHAIHATPLPHAATMPYPSNNFQQPYQSQQQHAGSYPPPHHNAGSFVSPQDHGHGHGHSASFSGPSYTGPGHAHGPNCSCATATVPGGHAAEYYNAPPAGHSHSHSHSNAMSSATPSSHSMQNAQAIAQTFSHQHSPPIQHQHSPPQQYAPSQQHSPSHSHAYPGQPIPAQSLPAHSTTYGASSFSTAPLAQNLAPPAQHLPQGAGKPYSPPPTTPYSPPASSQSSYQPYTSPPNYYSTPAVQAPIPSLQPPSMTVYKPHGGDAGQPWYQPYAQQKPYATSPQSSISSMSTTLATPMSSPPLMSPPNQPAQQVYTEPQSYYAPAGSAVAAAAGAAVGAYGYHAAQPGQAIPPGAIPIYAVAPASAPYMGNAQQQHGKPNKPGKMHNISTALDMGANGTEILSYFQD